MTGRRLCSSFVSTRIDEHPDADEAGALRELWNMAHDQIDITPHPKAAKRYVPGEVKNERALRELASQWSDHPDYQKEWAWASAAPAGHRANASASSEAEPSAPSSTSVEANKTAPDPQG